MTWMSLILVVALSLWPASGAQAQGQEDSRQTLFLSLGDVSRLALENNLDIQIAKFDAYIKRNDRLEVVSIYDTLLSASASYENNQFKQSSTIFGTKSLTNIYDVNLSRKMPTGTTLSLDFNDTRSFTNSPFATLNPSHEAVAKFSVSQALGRNFFGLMDRHQVRITKKDIENSDWSSISRIEDSLAETQKAFWKMVLLTQELDIRSQIYGKARELYDLYKKKRRIGLAEDPDFLGAEANMVLRENEVLGAIDALNAAKDDLLLLLNRDHREVRIAPLDRLALRAEGVDFNDSLKAALENRNDYKIARNNIGMKKLQLVMRKNSLWPEIDVEASFARNGLARKYRKAWDQVRNEDNPELFVGVSVQFPLENRKARGQYNKAKLEQARAIVELKKVERKILTEINDLVTKVNILIGRAITNKRVVFLQGKKLEAEEKRFRYGRSSSDLLIRYQEDLLGARLSLARSLYDSSVVLIDLKVAQQTLLDEHWKGDL